MNLLRSHLPDFSEAFACGMSDYLVKTLDKIAEVISDDLQRTISCSQHGWLGQMEPRIKVVSAAVLLVAIGQAREIGQLISLQLAILAVAYLARLSPVEYWRRVWVPSLLFAGLPVLPAIFSWVTPGDILWHIYQDLAITRQGLTTAAMLVLRTTGSLTIVAIVMKTTPWVRLTKALGGLGLPAAIVMVLDMTYRYLFAFLFLANDYLLGRQSRLVAVESAKSSLAWTGEAIAGFLRLAVEYSRNIALAMQARGYGGGSYRAESTPISGRDCWLLAIAVTIYGVSVGGKAIVHAVGF
jgi:cobalt/nickel transport system permease protein